MHELEIKWTCESDLHGYGLGTKEQDLTPAQFQEVGGLIGM